MTFKHKPELISFQLCPFVQRSVITLLYKNIPFHLRFIDLKNKPDWFLEISPLGKVPVLKIGDEVLFESQVINEYLDEVSPPQLHPTDPLIKAKNRAWIEFGSSLIIAHHQFTTSKEQAQMERFLKELHNKLKILESRLDQKPFFNGKEFSQVETAYAPLMIRLKIIEQKTSLFSLKDYPKLSAWFNLTCHIRAVQDSTIDQFEKLYLEYLVNAESFLSKDFPDKSL
ncbi:MAG: glutathione S-transferase family protein [Deltaproteobacteria bacterium]|nr:glutathione S-transferase family protein [Deltaproteobacteria bacterium]